jgi:hypothetical protein
LIGYFKKQGRTPKDMTLMMFDDHILLFKVHIYIFIFLFPKKNQKETEKYQT